MFRQQKCQEVKAETEESRLRINRLSRLPELNILAPFCSGNKTSTGHWDTKAKVSRTSHGSELIKSLPSYDVESEGGSDDGGSEGNTLETFAPGSRRQIFCFSKRNRGSSTSSPRWPAGDWICLRPQERGVCQKTRTDSPLSKVQT